MKIKTPASAKQGVPNKKLLREIKTYLAATGMKQYMLAKILQIDVGNFNAVLKGRRELPAGNANLFKKHLEEVGQIRGRVSDLANTELVVQLAEAKSRQDALIFKEPSIPIQEYMQALENENKFYRESVMLNLNMVLQKVSALQTQLAHLQLQPPAAEKERAIPGAANECMLHVPVKKGAAPAAHTFRRGAGSRK